MKLHAGATNLSSFSRISPNDVANIPHESLRMELMTWSDGAFDQWVHCDDACWAQNGPAPPSLHIAPEAVGCLPLLHQAQGQDRVQEHVRTVPPSRLDSA